MQLATAFSNIQTFLSTESVASSSKDRYSSSGSSLNRKKMRRFFKNSSMLPFILVGVAILVILFLAWDGISSRFAGGTAAPSASNDQRVVIKKAKATQIVNKTLEFPLNDQAGKEVSKLKYEIQTVELRDEIVVKGERATAIKGRTFLIANLKITNSFDKSIQVNVKDYIRLIIGNSSDKLAPDIHNDPVDVQAISTKLTRVGFPIDDDVKELTLQVGEIKGNKQLIKLDLK